MNGWPLARSTPKSLALLTVPAEVVTRIGPVVAPAGTVVLTVKSFSGWNVAGILLNVTPVTPPNPEPLRISEDPTGPAITDGWPILRPEATTSAESSLLLGFGSKLELKAYPFQLKGWVETAFALNSVLHFPPAGILG